MAQPSAHYKSLENNLELLRKRELSNQKRIASLEDKVTMLTDMVMELSGGASPAPSRPKQEEKTTLRSAYQKLNAIVKAEHPDLVTAWDIKAQYGFMSPKTVTAILGKSLTPIRREAEIDGETVAANYYSQGDAEIAIEAALSDAKVAIEYDEAGNFKSSALQSTKAALRIGSPGKFAVPAKAPRECILSIAEREMQRELRNQQKASVFVEGFSATYGRALGLDDLECADLLRQLVSSGKIVREGDIVKSAV